VQGLTVKEKLYTFVKLLLSVARHFKSKSKTVKTAVVTVLKTIIYEVYVPVNVAEFYVEVVDPDTNVHDKK